MLGSTRARLSGVAEISEHVAIGTVLEAMARYAFEQG
jgi:hypothetical protein